MGQVVALVEDEELISTMVRINLEQEGFQVLSFGDAESLLRHLAEAPGCCDIVLLDIVLPGMTGEEALPLLRRLTAHTPVLMMTARQDVTTRVNTLNQGADDYLAKPFNVEELIARVKALLRRVRPDAGAKEAEQ